jgi:hypothetical protein
MDRERIRVIINGFLCTPIDGSMREGGDVLGDSVTVHTANEGTVKIQYFYYNGSGSCRTVRGVPALAFLARFRRDFGVLFTFSNTPRAAEAAVARSSQLSSPLPEQSLQPAHHSANRRPPARQGRTPCWVSSRRPSASVYTTN